MRFTKENYIQAKEMGTSYAGKAASKNTLIGYAHDLKRAEELTGKPLKEWTPAEASALLSRARAEGLKATTVNRMIAALRNAFDWGINNNIYKGRNPMLGIHNLPVTDKLPTVLDQEEVDAFFAALDALYEERIAKKRAWGDSFGQFYWAANIEEKKYLLFFKVMYYAGLRISEVAGLKKRDVLKDGIRITGKGSKERFVPLVPEVLAELHAWVAAHPKTDYVFYQSNGHTEKPMGVDVARDWFQEAVERAGLPKETTPHNLRHSFATKALEKTGRIEVVQKLLGHANVNTTMIYAKIANERVKSEYDKIFA